MKNLHFYQLFLDALFLRNSSEKVIIDQNLKPEESTHLPTFSLIAYAMGVTDHAEHQKVIDDIRRLRGLYAGTEAEFKAPNGKDSLLIDSLGEEKGKEAWYAVRTEDFKKRFGDWEAIEIINKLKQRTKIEIEKTTKEIASLLEKYNNGTEGWKNIIITWAKSIIPDVIKDPDGKDVNVSRSNIRDALSHGKGPLKVLTLPKLVEMLNKGVLFHIESKQDKQGRKERYFNYAYPIQFESNDYIISIIIKEDFNGKEPITNFV